MCRLLGILSSEPTEFRICLREAPRSLAALSKEHRDGWGLAVWDDANEWRLDKGIACAHEDVRFHQLAERRGEVLIAHVRQKTVGCSSLENTHPFRSGRWVFAHNGTVKDLEFLDAQISPARRAGLLGETDSERLFAYFLSRLDEAGLTDAEPSSETDRVVRDAVRALRARPHLGAFNFLLSDRGCTYAHRFGRTLFLLERTPADAVRTKRTSKDGVMVQTPWSERRQAILIASERLTDEPWEEIAEGMLIRLDRFPLPRWRLLDAVAA